MRSAVRTLLFALTWSCVCRTAPSAAEPSGQPVTVTAQAVHHDLKTDRVTATGNVTIQADEVEMRGDRAEVDLKTNLATISGNVEVHVQGQTIRGESFTLDLKSREWHSESARLTLDPEFFQEGVAEPLYASGGSFTGVAAETTANTAKATSCDREDPHYVLVAQTVHIYPEDKLVAKNVKFRVGHTTLVQVPSYTISLKQRRRRQSLVPVVGYNDIEGAFAKTSYNYRADEAGLGTLYLDLMQKRGVGLGIEHEYKADPFWGEAYLYGLRDKQTGATELNARIQHSQMLSDELDAQLSLNYTRNNAYFFSSSSNLNAELNLRRQVESGQSALSIRRQTSTGFGTRTSTTSTLRHQQRLSQALDLTLTSNYRSNDTGSRTSPDKELNSTIELTNRGKTLDLLCRIEDRMDLDGETYTGDNFLFAFERLPEIIAQSDSVRLGDRKLFGMFPVRAEASIGKCRELPSALGLTRTYFSADLQTYTKPLSSQTDLRVDGSFRQTLYSNDTAQYVLNYGSEVDSDFARNWNFNVDYRKQQPAGFSPYRLDYASRYESLDARLAFDQDGRQQLSLLSGFDFERSQYRDLLLRYQLMPNDTYYLSLSTGYDLENGELRDLLTRVNVASGEKLNLDLNTRYSPRLGQLARVNTQLFWRPHRLWQVEALSGWNGFTDRFDFNQVKVTRDLHCWEAFLTWDQQRREMRLDLALKAFPAFDTRFGVGQAGQSLNTSVGQQF
jgi:LPS-assembly protein